jgi:glycosyltransferase 2 family protein
MSTKRILGFVVVLILLCVLIYLQVRTWRNFNWQVFWSRTEGVNVWGLIAGVVLTYLAYVLRAVRWRIFLKPVCKTTTARMLAPQFIGFSALALLGRAGEMIRPYIIAKKERLTFTSQIAVWGVERIFDMGAFAVLLALSFLSPDLRRLELYHGHWKELHWHWLKHVPVYQGHVYVPGLRDCAFLLAVFVAGLIAGVVLLRRSGDRVAQSLHDLFAGFAPKVAQQMREKVLSFSEGLKTIHDLPSALQLIAISIFMWLLIAFDYYAITHAYPAYPVNPMYPGQLHNLTLADQVVLMGMSMVGSMLQLPAVGGGSQLAAISMLSSGFRVEPELAVSCGMLIWAITFMAVIPTGLALARREHLSIRAVAEAEEKAAALVE